MNTSYNIKIFYTGLAAIALLILSVILFPVSFSALNSEGKWLETCYWFTQSAGKYGTVMIIFITSFTYTIKADRFKIKLITFIKSFGALIAFTSVLAFINEHVTKVIIKEKRPSHQYILQHLNRMDQLDSVYSLKTKERALYFENAITGDTTVFKNINPKILSHWLEEPGYSFPSGHSFNAFLLATIIAFSLYHSRHLLLNKLFFVPFVWAVFVALSRVALGAHTSLDVCFGGGLGFIISSIFLYFNTTKKLIIHKKN